MKTKNKLASGIVALSIIALTLTGCHNGDTGNSEANSAPTISATAPASAQESAKATESSKASTLATKPVKDRTKAEEKAIESQAMADMLSKYGSATSSIDVDKAIKDADPSLNKTFPKSKFDQKKAVEFGLNFMDTLIAVQNFYDEGKTKGSDWDVFQDSRISNAMDADLITYEKNAIKTKGAQDLVFAANADGTLGSVQDSKGKMHKVIFDGVPLSSWNTPDIYAQRTNQASTPKKIDKDAVDTIMINGTRTMDIKFKNGLSAKNVKVEYWVGVVPTGDGKFLVNTMDYKFGNFDVEGLK